MSSKNSTASTSATQSTAPAPEQVISSTHRHGTSVDPQVTSTFPPQITSTNPKAVSNTTPQITSNTLPQITFTDPEATSTASPQVTSIDPQYTSVVPQNSTEKTNMNENSIFYRNKIFVGGLPHQIEEIELKLYFTTFGDVLHTKIMHDNSTGKGRGFGFIIFREEDAVEEVLKTRFHNLKNKRVEVKRAIKEKKRVAQPNIYIYNNNNNIINNTYYDHYINNRGFIYNPHLIMDTIPCPPTYMNYLIPYYYQYYPYGYDEYGMEYYYPIKK
ncbi:nuclear polyadenylated RNA-binding protein 4-like [Humulus lupulus]|uniref:nuclear polyadenylated RNA-binding protein 4-like n=1 Tax=Humulus lupulus TaxID=3486 RepID=UPI002B41158F|nr:nuclear polyadenylated RNA-binding protein 4-like [Humulus lupulus]